MRAHWAFDILCSAIRTKNARGSSLVLAAGVIQLQIEKQRKKSTDIDAAIIATPSSMHSAHAALCVKRGIAVFIEKPLGVDVKELAPVVASAGKRGVVTMMGQSYRFHRGICEVKNLLEGNNVGAIRSEEHTSELQ